MAAADPTAGHREWLERLELAHFDPASPAMPYWLPAGVTVMRALREMWRQEHAARGYVEMAGPQLADRSLFETSGHAAHYGSAMFWAGRFGLKPMNCPGAMLLFRSRRHSYRELPLRFYCDDLLHRHEPSGSLNGILRAQEFRQDDAHLFVTEDGVQDELAQIFALARELYGRFGVRFRPRLGTAPADRLGDDAVWERASAIIGQALDDVTGAGGYEVAPGEGSFYAPKVDFLMTDARGREWQTGTVQVDLQLPARFGCAYVDASGGARVPVLIHRAIAGSFERFLGILLEHADGHLPPPMCPVQVLLAPVAPRHLQGAEGLADRLRRLGVRAEVGDVRRTVGALVREASARRVPRLAVVGDRELAANRLAVRRPGGASELRFVEELADEVTAW